VPANERHAPLEETGRRRKRGVYVKKKKKKKRANAASPCPLPRAFRSVYGALALCHLRRKESEKGRKAISYCVWRMGAEESRSSKQQKGATDKQTNTEREGDSTTSQGGKEG
jgi:hypothetical protein